ncbi:MAG: non-hydrolyzing UDP-N-acetylglucosamine 2-epimerase [Acidobacteriota bacterium]
MSRPFRIVSVAGARPNFMKIAPIAAELNRVPDLFHSTIVHTGQHYDDRLSQVFFEELGIPRPDMNLNVGSGSHAQQTAAIMAAFEPALIQSRADLVLVVGDVNSTIACALVAVKLGVPVAHVEAGLRSFDRTMPEEINRLLTDQISDLLFTTDAAAEENLLREGVARSKIHFVGNVMIDTLLMHRDRARALDVPSRFGVRPKEYALLTLHRPSNVDDPVVFERIAAAIEAICRDGPVIFPVHPRTRPVAERSDTAQRLVGHGRLRLVDPLGYVEFVGLMEESRAVLTDSGGVQEETTILGIPCLTMRDNTERPITLTQGTNTLVGTDPQRILAAWQSATSSPRRAARPPLWDGKAAVRIVEILAQRAGVEGVPISTTER